MTLSKSLMWTAIILIAIILIGIIGGVWYYNRKKNHQIELLTVQLADCKNAPADTVIHYDSIYVQGGTLIKLVPYKVIQYDTIRVAYKESFYDSVFKGDGWRFRYRLKTLGSLDYIEFSDLVAPKEIQYITRHQDTCITKPPAYKAKLFHYGLYTELVADNFTTFPGIGLGLQGIINDRLTIGLGAVYQDQLYGNLRIGILLK
jgi:hypothetical protein